MKVLILWTRLSGYFVAFLNKLAEANKGDISIVLLYRESSSQAPFSSFKFPKNISAYRYSDPSNPLSTEAQNLIEPTDFQLVFMCSWTISAFRAICKKQRHRGAKVLCGADNQFLGTFKQHALTVPARILLPRIYDNFVIPGDRQLSFVKRFGYNNPIFGLYTADVKAISGFIDECVVQDAFLFTGRWVVEKGTDLLLKAYADYRVSVEKPWPLWIVGAGVPNDVAALPGVEVFGFLQPAAAYKRMGMARCLILPSRFEPYGVVVHEAAAAGCLLILSHQVGASPSFLRPGVNGYATNLCIASMAEKMRQMGGWDVARLERGRRLSLDLAASWLPENLAEAILEWVAEPNQKLQS